MVTMQANALWAGNDYAYIHDRGNLTFSYSAQRVRVMRVFKRRENTWSQRMKTYVDVIVLDNDGTPKLRDNGQQISKTVVARDIVSEWEEYADERGHREETARKAREESQRKAAAFAAESETIMNGLERLGIPRDAISFPAYEHDSIKLKREVILNWMKNASSV
jgi:hypothetical protein